MKYNVLKNIFVENAEKVVVKIKRGSEVELDGKAQQTKGFLKIKAIERQEDFS